MTIVVTRKDLSNEYKIFFQRAEQFGIVLCKTNASLLAELSTVL